MNNVWNFFDAIYILSIQKSKRISLLKEHLKDICMYNPIVFEFIPAKKKVNNVKKTNQSYNTINIFKHTLIDETSINIAHNHFKLIEHAYYQGLNNVLILEDDIRFQLPFNMFELQNALNWIQERDWDMFYLGYILYPQLYGFLKAPNIIELNKHYLAHSYALSRRGMKKIITSKYHYQNQHIDKWYSELSLQKYGIYPSICFQEKGPALYEDFKFNIPFKYICQSLEIVGVAIPFILLLICTIIYLYVYNKIK